MKKVLSLIMSFLLIVCAMPNRTALADSGCSNGNHSFDVGVPETVFSKTYAQIANNRQFHQVTTVHGWKCDCGQKSLTATTTELEKHSFHADVGPHSDGGHLVTYTCKICGFTYERTYACPGNPCITINSVNPVTE